MFLFHLTPAERRAFAGLAKQLIAADEQEQPAETRALELIEAELGIPVANLPAAAPSPQLLRTFASRISQVVTLLELLALAYADGVPHPEEMEMLKTVALGLGISELRMLEMEDWVVQQLPLSAAANRFLMEEE